MHSTVQLGGNKSGKSNVLAANTTNLAKTVAALDEFKSGFPSKGLATISNKWWGTKDGGGEESTEDGNVKDETASEKQSSLVAIRKRIAEEGREALELGLCQGFGSKIPDKKDQDLLFQIFKSSVPKDWVTDSS